MTNDFIDPHAKTMIEMVDDGQEWIVRIVEDGNETVNAFVLEAYALAFAEGQRMRLGLNGILRETNDTHL